jgi:hypothetical protein
MSVAVLGAGMAGCGIALELASRGQHVVLFDRRNRPVLEASRWGEGKVHLGLVYANDPSFKTAQTMITGALRFTEALNRWVDLADCRQLVSETFEYAVPKDSALSVAQIEVHFSRVESYIREQLAGSSHDYIAPLEGPVFERADVISGGYDPEQIIARFKTSERAIDATALADLLSGAVIAHPNIELRMGMEVLDVASSRQHYRVICRDEEGSHEEGPFRFVANALWANRLVIDARMGEVPMRHWMNRMKVGVNIWPGDGKLNAPSSTFVLGAYGDIVRFQSGRSYLNWYPVGMFNTLETLTPIDWCEQLASIDHQQIVDDTISALRNFLPDLNPLLDHPDTEVKVEGGSIFAWGDSGIENPESELHERFDIGPAIKNGYVSLDTGKLTTAPMFSLQVADMICPVTKSNRFHSNERSAQ